ncbi:MAG TPA: trehalose-phosphatase [Rubrobacteraceae bacterium]|nr:trehalose-phosphatase [Rubrobacteraceae bacterium]
MPREIGDLPHAIENEGELEQRLAGKRLAVFLDYDGVLTPIVDRPEDAIISEGMREVISNLAERCPVCVVSGRDRQVVQQLMGLENLIVAGSHGFDIWSPGEGTIQHDAGAGFEDLLEDVRDYLQSEAAPIEGSSIETKKASVAIHYRLVAEEERPKIKEIVDSLLEERPDELKVTPGKMVYEVQPKIDWHKGKAVLYLLEALDLDGDDVMTMYLGDDVTDENAFEALNETSPKGIGIFVGEADHPEVVGRTTSADYILYTVPEVETFLDGLAR